MYSGCCCKAVLSLLSPAPSTLPCPHPLPLPLPCAPSLRNTNKVSRYTNEKVGTSGTPTGMDSTLVSYQAAR